MNRHSNHYQQTGVVIITALFIMALTTALAVLALTRFRHDTQRTILVSHDVQAALYAQGALAWAEDVLKDNFLQKNKKNPIDAVNLQLPLHQESHYAISTTITDMQARYNLNLLTDATRQQAFAQLLVAIDKNISKQKALSLAKNIAVWIGAETSPKQDNYYLKLTPPYRAAHQPMQKVSELRMVQGFDAKLYLQLLPYITALPSQAMINVQTAPWQVLMAIKLGMTSDTAQAITRIRATQPFVTQADLSNNDLIKNQQIPLTMLTTTSEYFLIKTTIKFDQQRWIFLDLLHRQIFKDKPIITKVWHSRGAE